MVDRVRQLQLPARCADRARSLHHQVGAAVGRHGDGTSAQVLDLCRNLVEVRLTPGSQDEIGAEDEIVTDEVVSPT